MNGMHAFCRQVARAARHVMLLGGSAEPNALNRWVILGVGARNTYTLRGEALFVDDHPLPVTSAEALFGYLEGARRQARSWPEAKKRYGLPMAGGLVGALGYGFARWCDEGWAEKPPQCDPYWPELMLMECEDWLLFNLETNELVVLSDSPTRHAQYLAQWQACQESPCKGQDGDRAATPEEEVRGDNLDAAYQRTFEASFSPEVFAETVEQLRAEIRRGQIYQANLSLRLQKTMALDPYALFERLCTRNPSPFSAFFKWPGGVVVCNSPERLVSLDETGRAQTRPIAGTRGRGATVEADEAIGQTLLTNEKELAEHRMLVDLARNDLGRVCTPGSVRVDELLVLERYSHVTHLVSNVTGQLKPEMTGWDLLRSLFPGGTITGCPKVRCVEILDAVEPVPRGFYTGSLGYLDAASPALDFNILIRSLFLGETDQPLVYNTAVHIGAGIVQDAVGAHEYRECLRKATASLQALAAMEAQASQPESLLS